MAENGSRADNGKYQPICKGGGLLLAWQLKGKRVLLVGGGPVAAGECALESRRGRRGAGSRCAHSFTAGHAHACVRPGRLVNVKDADAHLTVLAPRSGLCSEMKFRIFEQKVVDAYEDRLFEGDSDLAGFDMVLTAIDDADLSRRICQMCRARRIPVNVADVPPECDFYFGSLIRRGPLQVLVSTGGKGPRIAAQTRRIIERAIPENLGEAIERVGVLRALLRKQAPEQKVGARRMAWMIDVCETWSFDELANMTEADMRAILAGWEKGTVPSARRVRGIKHMVPRAEDVRKRITGRCPVAGYCTPWLGGIGGFVLGAAVASAILLTRKTAR
jgi:precorrin-2 dehydrogenase/sirohydrochlorin ferrochelatase